MLGYKPNFRKVSRSILVVLAILVLVVSLESASGSVSYYLPKESNATVSLPPVILEEGNVTGTSTIYTNSTSAKVSVAAPVWLSGWDKRVKITIDNNDVDSALSNFPVLVYLSNSSSGRNNDDVSFVFDELQSDANRKKIAVTTSDGTTQCYVEIERWDSSNEKAWLWVKVPNIDEIADTNLFLYYDADHANNTAYVGDSNSTPAENVWDTNFKGVWHLQDLNTSTVEDSTSNNNDGTKGAANQPIEVDAMIGKGQDFTPTAQYIEVGTSGFSASSGTVEVWGKAEGFSGTEANYLFGHTTQPPWNNRTQLYTDDVNGNLDLGLGDSHTRHTNIQDLDSNTWYHVVLTWNGTNYVVYVDSVSQASGTYSGLISFASLADIGNTGDPASSVEAWNGTIDEVRVSNVSRSAAWIKANYESGRDDLLDFGSEEKNIEDYVDNNTSDIGSPTDIGTHSNFPAQQVGPDATYDTLTEENTGGITKVGTDTSGTGTTLTLSFSHTLVSGTARIVIVSIGVENGDTIDVSTVTYGGVTMTLAVERITGTSGFRYLAEIWYILENDLPSDGSQTIEITCSGTAYELEVNGFCSEYTGVTQGAPEATDGASQSSGNTTSNTISPSDDAWVISIAGSGNAGSFTHGQGQVEVLDFQDASSTFAVAELRGASGETSLSSTYSGTVNRLCRVAASWTERARYELDLEVQWASADYAQTNEEICIKTGTFTGSENIQVNVWNTTGSSWDWIMNLTASSWNNVSVSSYLNSSNFTIRFKGGNETNDSTQDSWDIDATLLHVWTTESYDYVLRVVNQVADNWTVNLQVYDSSNIGRLSSLNISLHDGTSSNQIAVSGGSIVKSEGEPYNLPGGVNSTIYISISNLQATTTGTSYLYVHLKILVPNSSTYILYVITFEIT